MSGSAPSLLQHLQRRLRAERRYGGLLITLALALLGAPAWSALRNECDLCPPTCPMHRNHGAAPQAHAGHLNCHATPTGGAPVHPSTAHELGPSVRCATCGNHGIVPAAELPPMLLPATPAIPVVMAASLRPPLNTAPRERVADPPDTPPPIGAA